MIIKGKYYVHDLECVKNLLIYTTNGLDSEAFVAQQRWQRCMANVNMHDLVHWNVLEVFFVVFFLFLIIF